MASKRGCLKTRQSFSIISRTLMIRLVSQHLDYIDNREIQFSGFLVPCYASDPDDLIPILSANAQGSNSGTALSSDDALSQDEKISGKSFSAFDEEELKYIRSLRISQLLAQKNPMSAMALSNFYLGAEGTVDASTPSALSSFALRNASKIGTSTDATSIANSTTKNSSGSLANKDDEKQVTIAEDKLQIVIASLTNSLTISLPEAQGFLGESDYTVADIITRAVLVTVLYELTTDVSADVSKKSVAFEDIPSGVWYEVPVLWAKEQKLVQGVSRTRFSPEKGVTRQEMAQILNHYLILVGKDVTGKFSVSAFSDQDQISTWAIESVENICGLQIMEGNADGSFNPKAYVTKDEFRNVLLHLARI